MESHYTELGLYFILCTKINSSSIENVKAKNRTKVLKKMGQNVYNYGSLPMEEKAYKPSFFSVEK